ncbi:MAG: T9SS type A sorting domain-containing protein, partial [Candidatus Margulisbacteria bacterium]|nr:T9SS type A sorting domain-containing protein [Candidatus Margulisiibacteriota bacterium]
TYYYKISAVDALGLESPQTTATSTTVTLPLADIYIYPNPLTLAPSAEVVFGGLSGNETIRLYTLTGEFLTSAQPQGTIQWKWNTRNAAGQQIAPGIYLYLLTRPTGEKRIGKIAVMGKI